MKDRLFHLAAQVPEALWDRFVPIDCLLPYYHMVADAAVPHVSPLYRFRSEAEFAADLDQFLRGRRAITLREFIESVQSHGHPPKKSFLVTFDDGFREMHDVALPILAQKGVPAVFFLNSSTLDNQCLGHHQKIALILDQRARLGTRFPETDVLRLLTEAGVRSSDTGTALRAVPWGQGAVLDQIARRCDLDFNGYLTRIKPYLTSDMVRTLLKMGMGIGSHSVDHPRYADIPLAEQLRQTRESTVALTSKFSLSERAFAFPHTDRGVSMAFFDQIFGEGTIDVSFGTSGPARDRAKLNFQRFTMEKTGLPARVLLARQRVRELRLRLTGSTYVSRT